MTTSEYVLRAADVTQVYGSGRRRKVAVGGVDFTASSRRSIGIVGESGSGKSTMARLLLGLERPSTGAILANDKDLRRLRARSDLRDFRSQVQLIAQDTTSSFDPRRTLRDAIRGPLTQLTTLDEAAQERRVDETLELVRIPVALSHRYPHQVSGGQRQRMSIARALVVRPRILVCDEIVSALDVSVQGSILTMLKQYIAEHSTGLVFISHGLPATAFITDELVVMYQGKIVEQGPTFEVLKAPQHPHTQLLVAAHSHTAVPSRDVPVSGV